MGPEIIVVNRSGPIRLEEGALVTLTSDRTQPASCSTLPISYHDLASCGLQPGWSVFVGQYLFTGSEQTSAYLTVQSVSGCSATCKVHNACVLEGLQLTVHIGNMRNTSPVLLPEDLVAIREFGAKVQVRVGTARQGTHTAYIPHTQPTLHST